MEKWTDELAWDLGGFAQLHTLNPLSEEDAWQQHVDQTEGETDDWDDATPLPLFGSQWQAEPTEPPAPIVMAERYLVGSWPALKAVVVGWLQRWPSNAPLMRPRS